MDLVMYRSGGQAVRLRDVKISIDKNGYGIVVTSSNDTKLLTLQAADSDELGDLLSELSDAY